MALKPRLSMEFYTRKVLKAVPKPAPGFDYEETEYVAM